MRTSFVTSADGTRLRLAHWGDGPRDILLVHGYAEHAGRYERFGAALAAAGWSATLVELRGHGHSGGKRGHVQRWSDYTDDVRAAIAGLRPGWSMFGHSMGGLVSLEAVRSGIRPARLALSSPLLGVTVQAPKIKILAGRLLSRIAPSVAMKNAIDPTALSRDLEVGTAYVADPLVFDTITPRWYTEMMATVANVLAEPSWPVPLAMFTGTDDRVVDANVNKEFALKNRAYLRVYPDFRHEILNEIGKEQVTADIIGWLEGDAACATG